MPSPHQPELAPPGCTWIGLLSLGASLLGCLVSAAIWMGWYLATEIPPAGPGPVESPLLIGALVALVGGAIGVPLGMMVGIPLLWLAGPTIIRHRIAMTMLFGLVGLLGGAAAAIPLGQGNAATGGAELVLGSVIGALHAALYPASDGLSARTTGIALAVCAVVVPCTAYTVADVGNVLASEREFERRCAADDELATEVDRTSAIRLGLPVQRAGRWHNQRRWRSLYTREDVVPLDGARLLYARDHVFVPTGFGAVLYGGQAVRRHCLSERTSRVATRLRAIGLGDRPQLTEMVD